MPTARWRGWISTTAAPCSAATRPRPTRSPGDRRARHYALKATAVDNAGASGSSATATITVAGAAGGLVSAYGLDEGTGTDRRRQCRQGAPGRLPEPRGSPGRYGQALSFDGSDQVVLAISTCQGPSPSWDGSRRAASTARTCASLVMKAFDYGLEMCFGQLWGSIGTGTGQRRERSLRARSGSMPIAIGAARLGVSRPTPPRCVGSTSGIDQTTGRSGPASHPSANVPR